MKKFFLIVSLIFLVILVGAITLVATSFNPKAYQKQVIASIKELTGRDLFIGGTTSISWTPMPTVTMKNIRLANLRQSKQESMLTAENVRIEIEWSSLFKSPLVVKSIELTKPVLILERLASNRVNFDFPFLVDPKKQLEEMDFLTNQADSGTKIDSVIIQDGKIQYTNHVKASNISVLDINGDLAVDSIQGPFHFTGTGKIGKETYSFNLNSTAFKNTAPVDLTFKVTDKSTKSTLDISGKFDPNNSDTWFSGVGSFSIKKFNTFLEAHKLPTLPLAEKQDTIGNLSFELGPTSESLKDFTLRFGSKENATALTGNINRQMKNKQNVYTVEVGLNQLDIAKWTPYLKLLNWDWFQTEKNYPDISFKVKVKSIPYQKENIQDLALSGRYESGILRINKTTATLPGRTNITLTGSAYKKGLTPQLTIDTKINSDSVKTLLSWLYPNNQWIKDTKMLQKGNLVGQISLTPDLLKANIRELKLDHSVFAGTIGKTLEESPAYDIQIALNNFNLDSYTNWKAGKEKTDIKDLPVLLKNKLEQASWLKDKAIRVSLNINDGTLFNLPVSTTHLSGYVANNSLKVKTLNLHNIANSEIILSGTIDGIGQPQMEVKDFSFKLNARQLPLLMERGNLKSTLPLIQQAKEIALEATASGGQNGTWNIGLQTAVSDANIRLSGLMETIETNPSFRNFSFDIAHPNFHSFMKMLDPQFKAFPKLDGTFKTKGILTGDKRHFDIKDALFAVGIQKLTGNLVIDNKQIKSITANLSSPSIDLERYFSDLGFLYSSVNGFNSEKLNLKALEKWQINLQLNADQLLYRDFNLHKADIEIQLQNKLLKLAKFHGISDLKTKTPIDISAALDWNTEPKFTSNFDFENIPLRSDFMVLNDIAFGDSALSLKGSMKARGTSPKSFIQDLNGEGTFSLTGGQIIGTDVEQMIPIITRTLQRNEDRNLFESQFKRVLSSGKTALKDLHGKYTISNGTVRMMDLTLSTEHSTANPTQIIWDIPHRNLEISIPFRLNPLPDLPPFILGISINKNKNKVTPIFKDLADVLENRIKRSLNHQIQIQEQAAQTLATQKRTDRLKEAKKLADDARAAVAQMDEMLMKYPSDRANLILQSAQDALSLVNQASVREEPTDAQLIQMIEQSRLVLLKSKEFQRVLSQDTLFETQNEVDLYMENGQKMTIGLNQLYHHYPDVIVFEKLSHNATQNLSLIQQVKENLPQLKTQEQVDRLTDIAKQSYDKIVKAYDHAQQFDLTALEPAHPLPKTPLIAPKKASTQPLSPSNKATSLNPFNQSPKGNLKNQGERASSTQNTSKQDSYATTRTIQQLQEAAQGTESMTYRSGYNKRGIKGSISRSGN